MALNNDARVGIFLNRGTLYTELEAFFSREEDSARWMPIDRAINIYNKHRDNELNASQ